MRRKEFLYNFKKFQKIRELLKKCLKITNKFLFLGLKILKKKLIFSNLNKILRNLQSSFNKCSNCPRGAGFLSITQ